MKCFRISGFASPAMLPAFVCVVCLWGAAGGFADELKRTVQSGPVTVTSIFSPIDPTIGDELTLQIVVESAKDVEVLMPEFGEALERYTIVDFVPKQIIALDGTAKSIQTYKLQPFMSGPQSIPPILVEFIDRRPGSKASPDDFDSYELLTERIDFTVKSVVPSSASRELKPPQPELELTAAKTAKTTWIAATIILLVGAFILLAFLGRRFNQRVRKRNAYELARQQLDRLIKDRQSPAPKLSVDQFYIQISAVIRNYLENRFDVRAPELTTDEFLQLSSAESELSSEHQRLLSEFLQQADIVKFAGIGATEVEVQRSCDLAARFLEETRDNAPDVVVDSEFDGNPLSSNARTVERPIEHV